MQGARVDCEGHSIQYIVAVLPVVHPIALDAKALVARLARRPGLAWLDSDASAPRGARSYVASDPIEIVRAAWGDPRPLTALAQLTCEALDGDAHGFAPRYIGFIAYDAAWSGLASARLPRSAGPVLWFGRFDAVAVFEHDTSAAYIVADDVSALERFLARMEAVSELNDVGGGAAGTLAVEDPAAHRDAVRVALDEIVCGNVYQVNLARRFECAYSGSPLALFAAMRRASPVPFGFYLQAEEQAVLGRSMERFLSWTRADSRLETRPIKGTLARRSAALDVSEDGLDVSESPSEALSALREDPKEHAEHTMVVDLMRNDLGRVAVPGTVRVDEAFLVEPFAHLAHLVSTISCRTRPALGLEELLEATFPPGSVTGTPKTRAVALIERLERSARGIYCGAYGYISRRGDLDLAVAIRTAVIADGTLSYGAGGGIVSESDPQRETDETELKTRVLRDALAALDVNDEDQNTW